MISGARPAAAERAAETMAQDGVATLLSWGLAGGLCPDLGSGELVVANAVIAPDGAVWKIGDVAALQCRRGMLAGTDTVVLEPASKAALAQDTGAIAVDMETHRVAAVATRRGIQCFAVRAISDPSVRALPPIVQTAVGPDGRPKIGTVIKAFLRRPYDLPALLHAKRDSDLGLRTLSASAETVIPALMSLRATD